MSTENLDSAQDIEFSSAKAISEGPQVHLPGTEDLDSASDIEFATAITLIEDPVLHLPGTEDLASAGDVEFSTGIVIIDPPTIHLQGTETLETYATVLDPGDDTIVITGERILEFDATPKEGDYPLIVEFSSNLPSYASLVEWDFGDGQTSVDANPAHIYSDPGTYHVRLKADMFGVEYTAEKKSFIKVGRVEVLPPIKRVRTHWSIFKETYKVDPRE